MREERGGGVIKSTAVGLCLLAVFTLIIKKLLGWMNPLPPDLSDRDMVIFIYNYFTGKLEF